MRRSRCEGAEHEYSEQTSPMTGETCILIPNLRTNVRSKCVDKMEKLGRYSIITKWNGSFEGSSSY